MDDSDIVDLYLKRDESAISLTAIKYGPKLRRIADNILDDETAAEECENDTYLEAWNIIPPNEPRTYLFSFLAKITRHISIDICRKNASLKRSASFCELTKEMEECIPSGEGVEDALDGTLLNGVINKFLGTLTEDKRNIFVRRYYFFDTVTEIAERYGISESKVKTTLFRVREKLRDHLRKEGYRI